jgi:endonuclease/exonuclease/phosphatase (EEP) superfamily protein YafD
VTFRRALARLATIAGWGIVVLLWIVTIARLVAWDRWEVFAVLDAFTLVLYLPAGPIAVLALWRRHWLLAGASVVIVIAQAVLVAPELSAATPLPGDLHGSTVLRVFDANVYQNNPSMSGYGGEIRHDRPDLVTLEEPSLYDLRQLEASGALTGLPFRYWNEGHGSRSLFIASRYPLGATVSSSVAGLPYLARTTVALPRARLALWVVHTTAPTDPGVQQWNDQLDAVQRFLVADRPRPLLVVGDFNATWSNRGFRAILATGLVDAAAARGEDLDMTWSQLTSPLPPLLRIDHVLTGPGVVATSIHTQPGPGSDHRALWATVALIPTDRRRPADAR